MNRYLFAGIRCCIGAIKCSLLKLERGKDFSFKLPNLISPRTEITVDRLGKLYVGKMCRLRSGAKVRVRKNATVKIGENFSMSHNCMIVAWQKIEIGDNVQFGPGVLIYDHDHDYKDPGGLSAEKYKVSPISIGNNVWIGANVIVLRGSKIGDNCVIAAGTVIKGEYPENSLIYQKHEIVTRTIDYKGYR
ncbi:TPA: acyltransferase [Streptococcus suis]|nr:acyltransferase [Streptococcus suis]